jgi:hypothetical protein
MLFGENDMVMRLFRGITVIDGVSFLFIALFTYAAGNKLLEYDVFKAQIGKSPLIMGHAAWIAWVVPGVEILLSITFLVPRMQLVSLYGAYSLMLMFTLYIAFILNFSPYVPCSCGGILNTMGWTGHLIFNICFTLLAVVGVFMYKGERHGA